MFSRAASCLLFVGAACIVVGIGSTAFARYQSGIHDCSATMTTWQGQPVTFVCSGTCPTFQGTPGNCVIFTYQTYIDQNGDVHVKMTCGCPYDLEDPIVLWTPGPGGGIYCDGSRDENLVNGQVTYACDGTCDAPEDCEEDTFFTWGGGQGRRFGCNCQ